MYVGEGISKKLGGFQVDDLYGRLKYKLLVNCNALRDLR